MTDVLGYSGRRVIVTGAATVTGAAAVRILVDLGAEVHVIDAEEAKISGSASVTRCALGDPEQLVAAVARIGSIVTGLFDFAGIVGAESAAGVEAVGVEGFRRLAAEVVPLMIDGSAIVGVVAATAGSALAAYAEACAPDLAELGIRINGCGIAPGADGAAAAWPAVLLNSPRASYVSGQYLLVDEGPVGVPGLDPAAAPIRTPAGSAGSAFDTLPLPPP